MISYGCFRQSDEPHPPQSLPNWEVPFLATCASLSTDNKDFEAVPGADKLRDLSSEVTWAALRAFWADRDSGSCDRLCKFLQAFDQLWTAWPALSSSLNHTIPVATQGAYVACHAILTPLCYGVHIDKEVARTMASLPFVQSVADALYETLPRFLLSRSNAEIASECLLTLVLLRSIGIQPISAREPWDALVVARAYAATTIASKDRFGAHMSAFQKQHLLALTLLIATRG